MATSNVIKGQGFANDLEAARKRTVNGKARDPDGSQPFPLVASIPLESRVRLRVFDLHSLRKLVLYRFLGTLTPSTVAVVVDGALVLIGSIAFCGLL